MIPKRGLFDNSGAQRGFVRLFDSLLVPLIVVLVGVAAFGLGRLSANPAPASSLVVHQEGEASTTPVSTLK
jgi:hypothetical protein